MLVQIRLYINRKIVYLFGKMSSDDEPASRITLLALKSIMNQVQQLPTPQNINTRP